jgi:hypothetical protein
VGLRRDQIAPRGLTKEEAADYCGCRSEDAFDTWMKKGIVPGPIPGTQRWGTARPSTCGWIAHLASRARRRRAILLKNGRLRAQSARRDPTEPFELNDRMYRKPCGSFVLLVAGELPGDPEVEKPYSLEQVFDWLREFPWQIERFVIVSG